MNDQCDEARWSAWVKAHAGRLLLFARQHARSEPDAQDLVQDAMVESWRRHAGAGPPPLPLVFATIRRRAIDLARQADRRSRREEKAWESTETEWFDALPEDREMMKRAQAALTQLPPEQREVIVLKVWGGLTFSQIAETLGMPANTAASRYRYGLTALKQSTLEVPA